MLGYRFISFPRRGKKSVFVFIGALLLYVCLVRPNPNIMPTHYAMSRRFMCYFPRICCFCLFSFSYVPMYYYFLVQRVINLPLGT